MELFEKFDEPNKMFHSFNNKRKAGFLSETKNQFLILE